MGDDYGDTALVVLLLLFLGVSGLWGSAPLEGSCAGMPSDQKEVP